MNKRVIALILSAALLCNPCTAYAAEISSAPPIADSGISVVDSGMKEPNYYSPAYADYLLKLDNANAEKGNPTKLWLSYMIKWKKAIAYKQTPDNYVYQPRNSKARAATIPISSLPMGAKIADRDTKWYGETLIWIKISNDVLQPKEGENTTPTNITIKGQKYDWTVKCAVNNTKQLWVTEQSIARIPVNEEQSPAYQGSDMYNWYKPGGGDPYEIFGFNFYDGVLSADLKRYTVPSVPTLYEYRENLLKNKYVRTGLEYVAPPPYLGYGGGVDNMGYSFPYMAKSLYTVTKRTIKHPIKIMPLLYQDTGCSSHQDKPVIGVDWPGRVVTSSFYHRYDAGNDYNDYWFNGTNTTMSTGSHYRFYQCRSGAHPSGDVRPTIALKGTAQAYATPDSNGVYTLVPSLATPTLTQSFNAGTNKSTITASALGATTMQITYGGAVVATANGSSITHAAAKNGSYTAVASNGSVSFSAAINVTAIDDVSPVITNTAPAGGWAGSKTTTITLIDAKTPSGMQYNIGGGWVSYSAPFTYTFTANGSINVMARDKWGCTSGNKTISASQIDTTAPTAPSIVKSPTTTWHKDNVNITISGGSDVGSGINRYQYNISGGAWQNYSAPFAVASSATVNARTVDNVGLVSGGSNIAVNIDRITPTGIIAYNKAWTRNDVELRFTAADFGGSNVARVRAGAGGWVAGATTAQTVNANGSYSFTVEDNAGNPQTVTEAVACIDKVLPIVNEINFIKTSDNLKLRTLFNKQLEIDIKTSDNASGIHTVEYQLVEEGAAVDAGAWLQYSAAIKPRVAKRFSGAVVARCTDVASNISAILQADVTAEDTPPTAAHTLSTTEWTNSDVNIHIEAMDDLSGVASITLPDSTVVQGDNANYIVSINSTYRFIVTDKCGNVLAYDVIVSNIDLTPPTATHTLTPNVYTNKPVTIAITAADEASGVASITLPDGTVVQGDTASYTVVANDVYRFVVTDNAGNTYNYDVTVDKLDFVAPVITGVELTTTNLPLVQTVLRMFSPSNFRTQVRIGVSCTDDVSGVARVEYQLVEQGGTINADTWLLYNDADRPIIQKHFVGQIAARCTDVAGTTSDIYYEDVIVEDTPPTAAHTLTPNVYTNQPVKISVTAADDDSGVASITLPDGTVVRGDNADYIVSINDTYRFIVTDKCGNVLEYDVIVSNIDLTHATATHILTPNVYTNQPVVIGITASDDASGVASITLPDSSVVQGDTASYTAAANDVYRFVVKDNAGNTYNYDVAVDKLDYVQPKITSFTLRGISDSPVKSFMRSVFPSFFTTQVELLVTAEDDYSGIETIEYQVTPRGAVLDSGNWRVYDSGKPPLLEKEIDATVAVRTTDNANNMSAVVSKDAVIDGSAPIGSHTLSTTQWCNTYIIITVKAQDLWTKAKYITLPDGSIAEGDTATFRVVRNGNYEFILTDELGNNGTYIVPIDNIEEVYPTPPKLGVEEGSKPTDEMYVPDDIELGWDSDTIDVKSLAQSGIEKYQYTSTLREHEQAVPKPMARRARSAPTAKQWKDCGGEIIVSDEGVWDVQVRAVSYAGNISGISNYVLKNDYNPPTGTAEVSSNEIKFMAVDDLSGVKSIACEHDKATTLTEGSEVTCKMAETETHIYTVTDNAGLVAEIPIEYIRPNDDVSTGGSLVPKDEIFVVGDEPTPSIPLPLPQESGKPQKDDIAQSGTASGDKANDNEIDPPKKGEGNEPKNSTGDDTDKSSYNLLSQLANFMRGLLNSFIKLLQRLVAWFNSLPLALRVVIAVSWWLLVLLIIYYIYRRVKKARADKRGE